MIIFTHSEQDRPIHKFGIATRYQWQKSREKVLAKPKCTGHFILVRQLCINTGYVIKCKRQTGEINIKHLRYNENKEKKYDIKLSECDVERYTH